MLQFQLLILWQTAAQLPTSCMRGQLAVSIPSGLSQGVFGDLGVYGHGVESLGLFPSSREL